jgi:SAM-dependent methyltransferase
MPYQADRYWTELHDRGFDESTVGYPGIARSLNAGMYRAFLRAAGRTIDAAGLRARDARVLDVGSGTGIWIDFWERRGASEICGADLAQSSVDRLAVRWPHHRFVQVDIGDAAADLPGDNDIVSAMSILLHIVDDARFERAIANLGGALRAGGALITIEPAVVHRWWGPPFGPEANSKARPIRAYREALARAGLELELVRPATVLLANVVDTRSELTFRLLERYWWLLTQGVGPRERAGTLAAAALEPVDAAATILARTGPSAKVLLARKAR